MKLFLIAGSFFGFISVGLGAAGSHALRQMLINNGSLESFNIGIDYLFIHSILLLFTAVLIKLFPDKKFAISGWLFIAGNILFSLNLVVMSIFNFKMCSFLNPVGGILLMAGWLSLGIIGLKKHSKCKVYENKTD